MLAYLGALDAWIAGRRSELGALDAEILANPGYAPLTSDMALSMALWQAVKNRYDLLLVTWDSGRVGPAECERLSSLIWGRLDTTSSNAQLGGMSVSLPEACRLSDALVAQLRTRLNLDPAGEQQVSRLRDLRAQLERIRDQIRAEPPPSPQAAAAQVAQLAARVEDLSARRERGGDIGGLLGPLEIDAARYERDLIVGGAQRRENRDVLARARELQADLAVREQALRQLVDKTVAAVSPAPKYAVPDVAALGPMPNTRSGLDGYVAKLAQVGKAMQVVQDAYGHALAERDQLVAFVDALVVKASALGHADDPDFTDLTGLARRLLDRTPAPIVVVRQVVAAGQAQLDWLSNAEGGRA
ncbi:MAG: hypothetical protein HZY73_09790 [Micropruina sp.]|nr:MAG: hypothetical protein HZY73_09790 [Micropruina sp.]